MSPSDGLTLVGFVITLGVAIVGWAWARRADRRTTEALLLARSAEERADRLEQASLERRDVAWMQGWTPNTPDSPGGSVWFRNAGTDPAVAVELVVDYEPPQSDQPVIWTSDSQAVPESGARRVTSYSDEVGPNQSIHLSLPDFVADVLSRRPAGNDDRPILRLAARLTWRSRTGTPGTESWEALELPVDRWLEW